jgi:hypothetical protein
MDLAYWTGETGDVVGAREAAATVTKDMTQVLGANHRHTLFARGNVCRWTALSGEAGRARELATAVVEDMMGMLGADDPDTLNGRAHLANTATLWPEFGRQIEGEEASAQAARAVIRATAAHIRHHGVSRSSSPPSSLRQLAWRHASVGPIDTYTPPNRSKHEEKRIP